MKSQLQNAIKVSLLAIILSFGLSYALAWTAPTTTPPAGNVAAPINTSATAQTKPGTLTVANIGTNSVIFPDATVQTTAGTIPSGAVMYFNLSSCPSGWIVADGTNGTPDLRGEFIRGLDNGRGVDTGRTLGSWEADMLKNHTHSTYSTNLMPQTNSYSRFYYTVVASLTGTTGATGGVETRPRNVALLACVKS